jgi:hypothetical protein
MGLTYWETSPKLTLPGNRRIFYLSLINLIKSLITLSDSDVKLWSALNTPHYARLAIQPEGSKSKPGVLEEKTQEQ